MRFGATRMMCIIIYILTLLYKSIKWTKISMTVIKKRAPRTNNRDIEKQGGEPPPRLAPPDQYVAAEIRHLPGSGASSQRNRGAVGGAERRRAGAPAHRPPPPSERASVMFWPSISPAWAIPWCQATNR